MSSRVIRHSIPGGALCACDDAISVRHNTNPQRLWHGVLSLLEARASLLASMIAQGTTPKVSPDGHRLGSKKSGPCRRTQFNITKKPGRNVLWCALQASCNFCCYQDLPQLTLATAFPFKKNNGTLYSAVTAAADISAPAADCQQIPSTHGLPSTGTTQRTTNPRREG